MTNLGRGTNHNVDLYGQLRKAKPHKGTLRLFKGQAKRAFGHTGVGKI